MADFEVEKILLTGKDKKGRDVHNTCTTERHVRSHLKKIVDDEAAGILDYVGSDKGTIVMITVLGDKLYLQSDELGFLTMFEQGGKTYVHQEQK